MANKSEKPTDTPTRSLTTSSTSLKGEMNSKIVLSTSLGDIHVTLFADKAPASVANFLGYVESGFYDGVIFHRVIPGFMIQGGGFDKDMQQKKTREPVINEASNGLRNTRGTLAMARTSDPNSATSQFFVNLVDNPFLDHSDRDPGYTVFGEVTSGMEVVDKIAAVATETRQMYENVPVMPVFITSAKRFLFQ